FFELLSGVLFENPVAAEDALPDDPRFFDEKIVFANQNVDVLRGFGLIRLEFGESHFALRTDATSVDAKRRASRSTAGVSSGTKSAEFCASSKTSRNVHRWFSNKTLPVEESVRRTLISTRRL